MKKILITCLLVLSLFMTPAFANTFATIDIRGNAVIIQEDNFEFVVPIPNVTSVYMDGKNKIYWIQYYSYYSESAKASKISKEDYEKLKRLLIKTEQ